MRPLPGFHSRTPLTTQNLPVSLSAPLTNSISSPVALIASEHWGWDMPPGFGHWKYRGSSRSWWLAWTQVSSWHILTVSEREGEKGRGEREDWRETDSQICKNTNLNMKFPPSVPHLLSITIVGAMFQYRSNCKCICMYMCERICTYIQTWMHMHLCMCVCSCLWC